MLKVPYLFFRDMTKTCIFKNLYASLLPKQTKQICQFSTATSRRYSKKNADTKLIETSVRYNGVRIQMPPNKEWSNEQFESELLRLSEGWRERGARSAFLEIPIQMSHVIPVASKYGFQYHHARGQQAVLCKWLVENEENKIPNFSNHTVGVAGACYREDSNELLVVRDKGKFSHWWKFPGGYSDLGEYIGETATREVFEETGVRSEFKSILSFRQHHGVFYDQSDLYYICRLNPLTYELSPCPHEIEDCAWKNINELLNVDNTTPFVKMICRLMQHGQEVGFNEVDISEHDLENWARPGNRMKIFHRNIESYHD
eukprot:TCONS_00055462-protein